MSEQVSAAEEKTAVQADPGLSRKKRMALIAYLAILFIVALVVVTLSLVIQIHGNTEQYSTISEKAIALQEKNEALQEKNETLQQQVSDLESEKDSLVRENGQLQSDLDVQTEENRQLQAASDELKTQNENVQKAYDLLFDAKAARESGDDEAFQAAVKQLKPLYQYLSEKAQAEYDALISTP